MKGKTHQPTIETGLADELRLVFQMHRRRYGSRRIGAELKERGYKAGRHKIRKLLKEQGLQAIQPRSFVPKTTQSRHGLRASPNLLEDKFECLRPNQIWTVRRAVSDITARDFYDSNKRV
ncbi:IS3 family transposase [Runella sp. MFBS21]|uniref:IS3 family transposase n=1 Tax=Runella sp. MFBS21 TaxID=3034018 RepID=UPI0038F7EF72